MRIIVAAAALALPLAALHGQTGSQSAAVNPGSVTLYEYPAYLGRSVTITSATPDLTARSFARRAQSARATGEWQACTEAEYEGSCKILPARSPMLNRNSIVSLRPAADLVPVFRPVTGTATTAAAAATVDLDSLDADAGAEGQDVAFFARPALGGSQVSAGSNDRAAADAFCVRAGFANSVHASRTKVQSSNLLDLGARTRVRAFALRDVLCRR